MKDQDRDKDQRTNSQIKLQNVLAKIHDTIIPDYTLGLADAIVDSVRIDFAGNSSLLKDVIEGTHILDVIKKPFTAWDVQGLSAEAQKLYTEKLKYKILKMNPEEQKKHQIVYDKASKSLVDHNGKIATTLGAVSGVGVNMQAFVLAKDGVLYKATPGNVTDRINPLIAHSSFLSGKPVEMAGFISINKKGKIDYFNNYGGFYSPRILDMYRGIKKLQQQMPSAFTSDCKIQILGSPVVTINEFIKKMESPASDVELRPLHDVLREQRIEKFEQYSKDLKNTVSVKIELFNDGLERFFKHTDENKEKLKSIVKSPMSKILLIDSKGKISETIDLIKLTEKIAASGDVESMKFFLEIGAAKIPEFNKALHLYLVTAKSNEAMVELLLENKDVRNNLVYIDNDKKSTMLHFAASHNNRGIINSILKYPEGRDLLSVRDYKGRSPLQLAYQKNHSMNKVDNLVVDDLYKQQSMLVKDQLVNYFAEQMQGEEIIGTARLTKMKVEVVKILAPFALDALEEQGLSKHAGSIIRDAAKITEKKLDWRQTATETKNAVKNYISKIFYIPKSYYFKNILKNPVLSDKLKKLRESKAISVTPLGTEIATPLPSNSRNAKEIKEGR